MWVAVDSRRERIMISPELGSAHQDRALTLPALSDFGGGDSMDAAMLGWVAVVLLIVVGVAGSCCRRCQARRWCWPASCSAPGWTTSRG